MCIKYLFHLHIIYQEELPKSSGNSLDEHGSHGNRIAGSEMDEAIDQAFEAVIREDIEAGTRKQQRKSEGWYIISYNLYFKRVFCTCTVGWPRLLRFLSQKDCFKGT